MIGVQAIFPPDLAPESDQIAQEGAPGERQEVQRGAVVEPTPRKGEWPGDASGIGMSGKVMVRDRCRLCFLHSLSLQKAQKIPVGSCPLTFWNVPLRAGSTDLGHGIPPNLQVHGFLFHFFPANSTGSAKLQPPWIKRQDLESACLGLNPRYPDRWGTRAVGITVTIALVS